MGQVIPLPGHELSEELQDALLDRAIVDQVTECADRLMHSAPNALDMIASAMLTTAMHVAQENGADVPQMLMDHWLAYQRPTDKPN